MFSSVGEFGEHYVWYLLLGVLCKSNAYYNENLFIGLPRGMRGFSIASWTNSVNLFSDLSSIPEGCVSRKEEPAFGKDTFVSRKHKLVLRKEQLVFLSIGIMLLDWRWSGLEKKMKWIGLEWRKGGEIGEKSCSKPYFLTKTHKTPFKTKKHSFFWKKKPLRGYPSALIGVLVF